jgi:hypothetical protein
MVRLQSGETVSVNAKFQDEYGARRDEAFSTVEAAIEAWVKDQKSPDRDFTNGDKARTRRCVNE